MLQDKDRIYTNLYGFESFSLVDAKKRGDWSKTSMLVKKGKDWIIDEMKKSGLRGRGGGLVLAQTPAAIKVGKLVRETENLKLLECFGSDSTCPIDPGCKLKNALKKAQKAFLAVLDEYSLEDMVKNDRELEKLLFRGKPA